MTTAAVRFLHKGKHTRPQQIAFFFMMIQLSPIPSLRTIDHNSLNIKRFFTLALLSTQNLTHFSISDLRLT
jgi:hypothetical protein